jgi:hypothetical protein
LQRQFMSPQKVEHAGSNCSRSVLIFCCSIVGPCPWAGRGPVNWRRRLSCILIGRHSQQDDRGWWF